ncbi:MAG: heavy-metal-associated domain-containing protein [Clostridia bacterium]|nr:heavy-metal-associated domain-containing protein [Clostridia bacterium]
MKEFIIKVKGMVCSGCENRVQNALKTIEGVAEVEADYTKETVKITTNNEISEKTIEERIENLGFEVVKED